MISPDQYNHITNREAEFEKFCPSLLLVLKQWLYQLNEYLQHYKGNAGDPVYFETVGPFEMNAHNAIALYDNYVVSVGNEIENILQGETPPGVAGGETRGQALKMKYLLFLRKFNNSLLAQMSGQMDAEKVLCEWNKALGNPCELTTSPGYQYAKGSYLHIKDTVIPDLDQKLKNLDQLLRDQKTYYDAQQVNASKDAESGLITSQSLAEYRNKIGTFLNENGTLLIVGVVVIVLLILGYLILVKRK